MRAQLAKVGLVSIVVAAIAMALAVSASAKEVHILSGKFGAGELSLAVHSGLAVDQETGDVYVADTGHARVARYTASGAPLGTFAAASEPSFLAVDNSTDASEGDLYVVEKDDVVTKLGATGSPVTSWGTAGRMEGFGEILGIAVDSSGNLFVLGAHETLHELATGGSEAGHCTYSSPYLTIAPDGIEVDGSGHVFSILGVETFGQYQTHYIGEMTTNCEDVTTEFGGYYLDWTAIGIDEANHNLFRGRTSSEEIEQVTPKGEVLSTFGENEGLDVPDQLAVQSKNEVVYATSDNSNEVGIYEVVQVEPPKVTIEAPTNVTGATARFHADVDPQAPESDPPAWEVKYRFQCVPGCQGAELAGTVAPGSKAQTVEGTAEGLLPGTEYQVYITAENAGGEARAPEKPVQGRLPDRHRRAIGRGSLGLGSVPVDGDDRLGHRPRGSEHRLPGPVHAGVAIRSLRVCASPGDS